MKLFRRLFYGAFLVALLMSFAVPAGAAEKYPTKPITVTIPFGGGGAANVIYRALFDVAKKYVGQPMVVVNKEGSGGAVGWTLVQAMKPDGYNLAYGSNSIILQTYRTKGQLDYRNFVPIVRLNETPCVLAVNKASGWNTLADFIKYAKKNPGKARVGNAGAGAFFDLATYRFEALTGTKVVHVPYKGGPLAAAALLGEHIEAAMLTSADLSNVLSTGKIKMLGMASEKRYSMFPDIPTMKEQGVNLDMVLWRGLIAPKGMAKEKIKFLDKALEKATKDPKYVEFMKKRQFSDDFMPTDEFSKKYYEEGTELMALLKSLEKK
jgi:tripartite-type tricarboxylate transporter receptor subunit TctC